MSLALDEIARFSVNCWLLMTLITYWLGTFGPLTDPVVQGLFSFCSLSKEASSCCYSLQNTFGGVTTHSRDALEPAAKIWHPWMSAMAFTSL